MKKISFMLIAAAAAYAFQGCHTGGTTDQPNDSIGQKADVAKTVAKADTPDNKKGSPDVQFAQALAAGGTAEIKFSELARKKVRTGTLKNFAAMMIADHTKAADSLKAIASREGITLPVDMDRDHQSQYDVMDKSSGNDFISAYVRLMVADHKNTVDLLKKESQNGKDAALKDFANKILPTVQMHLDSANKMASGMR